MPDWKKRIACANCHLEIPRLLVRACRHCGGWYCGSCVVPDKLSRSGRKQFACFACQQRLEAMGWRFPGGPQSAQQRRQVERREAYLQGAGRSEKPT